jgi:tetratricopeptide (TPR) repeat protein
MRHAYSLAPDDSYIQPAYLTLLLRQGRFGEAFLIASELLSKQGTPKSLRILSAMAVAQSISDEINEIDRDRLELAYSTLKDTLSSAGGASEIQTDLVALGYLHIGYILQYRNDLEGAKQAFESSLQAYPQNPHCEQTLQLIKQLSGSNQTSVSQQLRALGRSMPPPQGVPIAA